MALDLDLIKVFIKKIVIKMSDLNLNKIALEFFKTIKEMIDSRSTCSEILDKINEQPFEIKSLFEGKLLITLKSGKDNVLKDQFTEVKIGIGKSLEEALKAAPPIRFNDFDDFLSFIMSAIRKLEQKK